MAHRSRSYKHPIRIEQRVDVQDDYDSAKTPADWDPVVDLSASIRTLSAREQTVASQQGQYVTHEFMTRYYPGIDTKMRILMQNNDAVTGRRFNIVSAVDVDEEHFELKIQAIEKN